MKYLLNLLLVVGVICMVGCTTAPKVQPMADNIAVINALSDTGCEVAEYNHNDRRGALKVVCNGPYIND